MTKKLELLRRVASAASELSQALWDLTQLEADREQAQREADAVARSEEYLHRLLDEQAGADL